MNVWVRWKGTHLKLYYENVHLLFFLFPSRTEKKISGEKSTTTTTARNQREQQQPKCVSGIEIDPFLLQVVTENRACCHGIYIKTLMHKIEKYTAIHDR